MVSREKEEGRNTKWELQVARSTSSIRIRTHCMQRTCMYTFLYTIYTSWLYRSVRFRSDIHISAREGLCEATTAGRGISMTCRADCAVSRLAFEPRSFSPLDQRRKRVSRAFCVDVERDICSTPTPLSSSPKTSSSEAGRLGRPPRWSQLKNSRTL